MLRMMGEPAPEGHAAHEDGGHEHGEHEHGEHGHEHGAGGYVCPMHPHVVSESPGRCPECGMDLVPRSHA